MNIGMLQRGALATFPWIEESKYLSFIFQLHFATLFAPFIRSFYKFLILLSLKERNGKSVKENTRRQERGATFRFITIARFNFR